MNYYAGSINEPSLGSLGSMALYNETILHYHLEVQANPQKMAPKNQCYF